MLFNFSGSGQGRAAQAARHRQGPLLLPPGGGEDKSGGRGLRPHRPVGGTTIDVGADRKKWWE